MMQIHSTPSLVHINDLSGTRVYNFLLDDGSPILNFTKADGTPSRVGFLRRDELPRLGLQIVPVCGDCEHEGHDGAVCIVLVDRHSASQGDGEGECMCGASTEDYRRWSLS